MAMEYHRIGWLSWATGSFMNSVVGKANGAAASGVEEVLIQDTGLDVEACYKAFETAWQAELALLASSKGGSGRKPSLLRALWRSFRSQMLYAAFMKMWWGALMLMGIALFVREILNALNKRAGRDVPLLGDGQYLNANDLGYTLTGVFFLVTLLHCMCIQQMGAISSRLGLRVKAAMASAVYRKTISHDRHQWTADILSLVATDCSKLADSCTMLQYLWSGAVEALAIMGLLLGFAGKAALPGCGVMVLLMPFQYIIGMAITRMRFRISEAAGDRLHLMEEILRAIKLVKMYAWERKFAEAVAEIRARELHLIMVGGVLKSFNIMMVYGLPPLMGLSIFGVYELERPVDSVLSFTTLSLFNTLRLPLIQLPKGIRAAAEAKTAIDRLQRFLLAVDREASSSQENSGSKDVAVDIVFKDADLAYGASTTPLLRKISTTIPIGKLAMVAGPVGCGKSNFLMAIMGQMKLLGGTAKAGRRFAYVPQSPWCSHGSVRDNIVFGQPWDEERYKRVLFACALETDMKLMEHGDATQIGERGMNLSGGQKQRIALARAAYSGAKTFILDAPLSAVDMYTCAHIFKHCIRGIMTATGATVVLVTHQVELFPHADQLLFLERGALAYNGPFDKATVQRFYPNATVVDAVPEETTATSTSDFAAAAPAVPAAAPAPAPAAAASAKAQTGNLLHGKTEAADVMAKSQPKTARKEEKERNSYMAFFGQFGWVVFIIVILIHGLTQGTRVGSDVWISEWVGKTYGARTGENFYVGIYGAFVGLFLCLMAVRSNSWFWMGRRAATRMHREMFQAILAAPMHFFTATPLGKVLSTFSKDIDSVDHMLVDEMHFFLIELCILLSTSGVVIANYPYFAAVVAGVALCFSYFFYYYIRTAQCLKDLSGTRGGAVVSSLSETLQGLDVILAYGAEDRYRARNTVLLNIAGVANYNLEMLQLWLSFRLDFLACLLVLATWLLALGLSDVPASRAGLAISNSFQILLFVSLMVKRSADINANISSVQRVLQLGSIESEVDVTSASQSQPNLAQWPGRGELSFQGVMMAYAPNAPLVLKGVDFDIRGSEKIGVVGRTGAGKSSLIMAIFRLAELADGVVRIDGVDNTSLRLGDLRKRIAIIPQEPVMFHGTLRGNLDPFEERSDEELLHALKSCLLSDLASGGREGLQQPVAHMGGNFSLGQQQLICLARAMLNPSKLLLLDEATAALDSDTDAAVQRVLRANFADRTTVTIAHRLDTIIDSDRILVMNAGKVAEFDSPYNLLHRPSIFAELCRQTGGQYGALKAAAERHHAATHCGVAPTPGNAAAQSTGGAGVPEAGADSSFRM